MKPAAPVTRTFIPREAARPDMFVFVESYFSNYIEGTTFTVAEAEDIVFRGKLIAHRHEDSHDVIGTFEAAQRDPFYTLARTARRPSSTGCGSPTAR